MAQSTRLVPPRKPYPEFPLTPHPAGKWVKKINGSIRYFGRWARTENRKLVRIPGDGIEDAMREYRALVEGRAATDECLVVRDLVNRFLTSKQRQIESGELSPRTLHDYHEVCELIVSAFGRTASVVELKPDDFARLRSMMTKRWGVVRVSNGITRAKAVFKFAHDNALIPHPVRFGTEFRRPSKAALRRHRADQEPRMLEAADIRRLLPPAGRLLRPVILLGINCGFGNGDVAGLRRSHLDLDTGWVNYPRPKTGIARRCPLWPETVQALRDLLASRPEPAPGTDPRLVFLTVRGTALVRVTDKSRTDNISIAFQDLLKAFHLHRDGIGFYTLRHVFRTIADGSRDQIACDVIMGHADSSIGAHYRERVDDARLVAVADHVRAWLFPETAS